MPVVKRYQVFVSSTYRDLEEERREVIQALLELDCIPSGMEMFPATNDDQWSLIKNVIDDCDYYVVIIGGRYGSIGPDGLSYTEMEYRYATAQGKPVIAFLHKHPGRIPAENTEKDADSVRKLEAFKELTQKKLVRFWETPSDLGSVVSRSLIKLIRDYPADGWVRGGNLDADAAREEVVRLGLRLLEMEAQLAGASAASEVRIDGLAKGDDLVELRFDVHVINKATRKKAEYLDLRKLSWNQIFSYIAPGLINEGTTIGMTDRLSDLAARVFEDQLESLYNDSVEEFTRIFIQHESIDIVVVQFVALGFIQKGTRKRTVNDSATYFGLTPLGERTMYELRAIRSGTDGTTSLSREVDVGRGTTALPVKSA